MKLRASLTLSLSLGLGLIAQTPSIARGTSPPSDAGAAAESLFREGRTLMASGDFAAACPKLAESQRIDPSLGTLLNLGDCYERLGRTASAWATFNEAASLAIRSDQTERARFAQRRAAALEPMLPTLVIEVSLPAPGLVVERDGVPLGSAGWGAALPVDPGAHRITATAPRHRPWSTSVSTRAGTSEKVAVPPLARDETRVADSDTTLRSVGIVGTATGGALVVTGLALGLVAKSKDDEANRDECSSVDCSRRGTKLIEEASSFATASTVVTIAGAAVAVAGVTVWLIAPGRGPRASLSAGRVSLEGRF